MIADKTFRIVLSCGFPADIRAGEFVDIALEGKYLRRPISVCDCEDDKITLLYKVVGEGTEQMSKMQAGEKLDILVGLGHGFDPSACKKDALLVGGGLGAAPMHLLCKELLASGKNVSVVLGFNKAEEKVLEDEFKAMGVKPVIATLDGSCGTKGFVTDAIAEHKPEFDYFYTCGPMPMMRALSECLDCDGECSLEERMGCGAGFCYTCSCHTVVGARRVCKDGPVFKKEEIIW